MTDLIAVTYDIDNFYEDGTKIHTIVETEVPPPPPGDTADYDDWENDHVFNYAGADYPEGGDAGYFVRVLQSSDPIALPPGTEYEFV